MLEIVRFQQEDGAEPYTEWYGSLRDGIAKANIAMRLHRIESGNLGDCKAVGEGVHELRIHVGPGYRIYCGFHGELMVILLGGGDKSTQVRDIARAKTLWTDWRRRQR